jgi:uncharacterized membrane protein YeaQ/YmgE (transglycosylase-associated protein family)
MLDPGTIIIWLVIGAIAGWLAKQVMGGGWGLVGDIVIGLIGAVVGGWLLARLGFVVGGDFLGAVIDAAIGAIILLFIARALKR